MTLTEYVTGTYAMIGQEISDLQLAMTVEKLSRYPEEAVKTALSRAQDECKRLTYTDILDRIPGGHPGPEQAWSVVQRGMQNEALTMVWTDAMREAYGVAAPLVDDPVAARMAFKETYQQLVSVARSNHAPLNWSVSLGTDPADREVQITEGAKAGRLTRAYARTLLPHVDIPDVDAVTILRHHAPHLRGKA